jgi:hypothetical protein
MVKLQKQKAYTYTTNCGEEVEHYKHTVVILEETVHHLGWKAGIELAAVPKGNSLVLKPEKEEEE